MFYLMHKISTGWALESSQNYNTLKRKQLEFLLKGIEVKFFIEFNSDYFELI